MNFDEEEVRGLYAFGHHFGHRTGSSPLLLKGGRSGRSGRHGPRTEKQLGCDKRGTAFSQGQGTRYMRCLWNPEF